MAWDDNANVCEAASLAVEAVPEIQELISQSALEETTAIASTSSSASTKPVRR
jgi:hypothetical protein